MYFNNISVYNYKTCNKTYILNLKLIVIKITFKISNLMNNTKC